MASLTSRVARCEHGRMLRHDPEPTAAIAATSGRPCGLHTTASHTGGMVAPSDPGVRATQVGGFIFGRTDPSQNVIQVQAVKAGITTITGVLMGRSDGFLHFPPARRNPPPYFILPRLGLGRFITFPPNMNILYLKAGTDNSHRPAPQNPHEVKVGN